MFNLIKDNVAYVSFIYEDGSRKILLSTLSSNILKELNIIPQPNRLYDFMKKEFVEIPTNAKIEVTEEMPQLDPVDAFMLNFL